MTEQTTDPEIEIIHRVYHELAAMNEDGRRRAIRYLSDRLLPRPQDVAAERGAVGGHARAAKLSAAERSAIAKKAAISRWQNGAEEQDVT